MWLAAGWPDLKLRGNWRRLVCPSSCMKCAVCVEPTGLLPRGIARYAQQAHTSLKAVRRCALVPVNVLTCPALTVLRVGFGIEHVTLPNPIYVDRGDQRLLRVTGGEAEEALVGGDGVEGGLTIRKTVFGYEPAHESLQI